MRFNSISIRDYKAIRSVTIRPRETGVTIVEGENEVGKSSIAEALWLIFDQNDDSSSQLVKGLKPVGRDAATEIEVEVSTGEYRFRYFKRFHRGPRTELEVFEPRREMLSGREAHNRARQILDQTIDRALWEALRLQQGASLEPLAAGDHQSLLSALDVAAGEILGGDREQTLFDRIQQEYERYYTASGRERSSADSKNAPRLRRDRDDAQAEVDRLDHRVAELEERAVRHASLTEDLSGLEEQRATVEARRAELAERVERRRELERAVEAASGRVRILESTVREFTSALRARADAEAALAARIASRDESMETLAVNEIPLATARAAVETAETAASEAGKALQGAREAENRAESLVRLAERELQAQQMAERLERIERHEPEMRELVAWLNQCKVDQRSLQEIDRAEKEVARAEAQRDAAGASVEVTVADATTISIDGRETEVTPERPLRGKVLGETTLSMRDGVVVRVRAGQQARELASHFADASRALKQLLTERGVDSAQAARDVFHERGQKEERRRSLAEQIKSDLRDLSAADLRDKLNRERAALDELRARAGADLPSSLDEAKARAAARAAARTSAEEAEKLAGQQLSFAKAKLDELERVVLRSSERLKSVEEEIARASAELERLSAADAPQETERQLNEATAALEAERKELATAEGSLAGEPDISSLLAESRAELDQLDRRIAATNLERASIAGVLEDAGADGLHGHLVEAQQRLALAEAELEAFQRRAAAARTLFEAMRQRRDEARENYSEPLRRQIESLGKLVLGETLRIELSEDLRIARVARHGVELEIAQLSIGLREQLAVLTRLACASLVSESGGAPVVLDDIFGWADPARLARLGPVLAAAAKDTQVLLFTCSPGRFTAVVPARVISLPTGTVTDRDEGSNELRQVPATPERPAPAPRHTAPPAPAPQAAFDLFAEPEPAHRN
ncbi:MAG: AAA family ATPase [Dehalococcoidia bacterium]